MTDFGLADLFAPTAGQAYTRVCICFMASAAGLNHTVQISIYDDDGAGGAPGTLLGQESFPVAGVPGFPGQFYAFDLATPVVSDGSDFVGVRYVPLAGNNLFVCADESAGTPPAGGYAEFLPVQPWIATGAAFLGYRSMLIRAEVGAVPTMPDWAMLALLVILLAIPAILLRRRRNA